jgi:rRNA maturation endonuclease Nob1
MADREEKRRIANEKRRATLQRKRDEEAKRIADEMSARTLRRIQARREESVQRVRETVQRSSAMLPIYERLVSGGVPENLAEAIFKRVAEPRISWGVVSVFGLVCEDGVRLVEDSLDFQNVLSREGIQVQECVLERGDKSAYRFAVAHWRCTVDVSGLRQCLCQPTSASE